MINDLLVFNSFASGAIQVRQDRIDLGKLLREIVYQWEQLYQEEGLVLEIDVTERTFMATGDSTRIQQIVVNLLNNSRQALQGKGTIRILLSDHSNQTCEVRVSDNGPGIPDTEQARIFERYFRRESKKPAVGGLGLGLTYSRMLAEAMQGQLNFLSSSPEGTAFQLLLPQQP
jgi:signal transduction histidine kinase